MKLSTPSLFVQFMISGCVTYSTACNIAVQTVLYLGFGIGVALRWHISSLQGDIQHFISASVKMEFFLLLTVWSKVKVRQVDSIFFKVNEYTQRGTETYTCALKHAFSYIIHCNVECRHFEKERIGKKYRPVVPEWSSFSYLSHIFALKCTTIVS